MSSLLTVLAAASALIGFIFFATGLFTPRRYTARRPQRLVTGGLFIALSVFLHFQASKMG